MDLLAFSDINRARCEGSDGFNHPLDGWSLSDWFTATLGELGEAANIAKKLNRVRDGIPGNSETPEELQEKLGDELADTFIYLDLLAQRAGISLQGAVIRKFNATSRKLGGPIKLCEASRSGMHTFSSRDAPAGSAFCIHCGEMD